MKRLTYFLSLLLGFLFFISCASQRLEKTLDPESREFLSKVRYIISKEERKTYLHLPPSERKAFIEDFWKHRDPDPETEENEYKDEYFKRIDEANHLFTEGATPGWLQDRGRVFILLGPPWERETYPRGITFYGKPTEIWHYGFYMITFIDHYWNGNYKLEPDSAWQIAELNRAQMVLKPKVSSEKYTFEFDLTVKKITEKEVTIQVKIPYKKIWFEEKNNELQTTLSLTLEIFDSTKKKVWDFKKDYPISLTEEELEGIIVKDYSIETRAELPSGKYSYMAELLNQTDGHRAWKKGDFQV